jgi:hypothetical protein
MSNPADDILIFILLDNTDPSFIAWLRHKKWDYIYLERYAYPRIGETLDFVAAAGWLCDGNCFTHTNYMGKVDAFAGFAESVKTGTYNTGKIRVVMSDYQTNEDLAINYSYNFNY